MDNELKEIYYNETKEGSYGGIENLLRGAQKYGLQGVSRAAVRDFLEKQDAYTLHKPIRRKFRRAKTIVGGIDKQWQADLADLTELGKHNEGHRYILTVIDCFSKFAWAIPVKTKSGPSVREAFEKVFEQSNPRIPNRLQTDKGKEFFNKEVLALFKSKGIHHFASESDQKAAIAERFNRTLKTKMWRYFTANNTYRFLEALPGLVTTYNNSVHRTIGMRPSEVNAGHEAMLWQKMYPEFSSGVGKEARPLGPKQTVRISKVKRTFDKGYLPNWTEEPFKVRRVDATRPQVYKLEDLLGENLEGIFYKQELQKIAPREVYLIEKVLSTRKRKGKKEHLVKWQGLPSKFNSWVEDTEIQRQNVTRK